MEEVLTPRAVTNASSHDGAKTSGLFDINRLFSGVGTSELLLIGLIILLISEGENLELVLVLAFLLLADL